MRIKTQTIPKFICAAFVLYYTWLRVIIPRIEGYLLPFGLVMIGSIVLYIMNHHVNLLDAFDFPITSWIFFCIVEYVAASFIAVNVSFAHTSIITFLELVMMCFSMVFIAKLDGNSDFLIKLMYFTCVGYVASMLVINNQIMGRLALVNANGDANVCLIGIVAATIIIDFKKRAQPFFVLATVCMMFYANIMTGSRKSFLCMVFYLFFWFIVFFKTDWKLLSGRKRLALFGVIIVAVFMFARFVTPLLMRSTTILRLLEGSEQSDSHRLSLYKEAWEYFKGHPLFGIGYNQFRVYNAGGYYSHSTYAEILADGGIVGFILFFAPHLWCLSKLVFVSRKYAGIDFTEMKKALSLLIYMISSLLLAAGMVQTSNERVLMMYAVMFAYVVCDNSKKRANLDATT